MSHTIQIRLKAWTIPNKQKTKISFIQLYKYLHEYSYGKLCLTSIWNMQTYLYLNKHFESESHIQNKHVSQISNLVYTSLQNNVIAYNSKFISLIKWRYSQSVHTFSSSSYIVLNTCSLLSLFLYEIQKENQPRCVNKYSFKPKRFIGNWRRAIYRYCYIIIT